MKRVRRYLILAALIVLGVNLSFPETALDPKLQKKLSRVFNIPFYPKMLGRVKITGYTSAVVDNALSGTQTKAGQKSAKNEREKQPVRTLPPEIMLSQNRPNPFNPTTAISFTLPERQYIQLKVYDLLGKEVATLDEGIREAGTHVVRFKADDLPSSLYFYELITNTGFRSVKKMLLVK